MNPSALRETFVEVPNISWNDIGGPDGVKRELQETVQYPVERPEKFEKFGMSPSKGVLFYGPPGDRDAARPCSRRRSPTNARPTLSASRDPSCSRCGSARARPTCERSLTRRANLHRAFSSSTSLTPSRRRGAGVWATPAVQQSSGQGTEPAPDRDGRHEREEDGVHHRRHQQAGHHRLGADPARPPGPAHLHPLAGRDLSAPNLQGLSEEVSRGQGRRPRRAREVHGGLQRRRHHGDLPEGVQVRHIREDIEKDMERRRLGEDSMEVEAEEVVDIKAAHFEESMKYARRSVSDGDIRKYQAFAHTLQQSRGFGAEFRFPAQQPQAAEAAIDASAAADEDDLYN
ncbi:hypothetical protein ACQ4PT_061164 [Festuca glaucescens]